MIIRRKHESVPPFSKPTTTFPITIIKLPASETTALHLLETILSSKSPQDHRHLVSFGLQCRIYWSWRLWISHPWCPWHTGPTGTPRMRRKIHEHASCIPVQCMMWTPRRTVVVPYRKKKESPLEILPERKKERKNKKAPTVLLLHRRNAGKGDLPLVASKPF